MATKLLKPYQGNAMPKERFKAEFWTFHDTQKKIDPFLEFLKTRGELFVVTDTRGCGCGLVIVGDCDDSSRQARIITDALNAAYKTTEST